MSDVGATPPSEAGPTPPRPDADGAAGIEVRIDWETCIGSGNCVFWAPGTFDLSDDGHAVVLDPTATDEDRLVVTAQGCPVGAISLWRGARRVDGRAD
jgi:ferredoxin